MKSVIFNFLFKVYRIMGRTFIKYSKNPRPDSYPYITGDGFRNLADHIYDNAHPDINPNIIKDRDIIFIGDSRTLKFLMEIHPLINAHYVLITHNGDEVIDLERITLADDKVIKWYGINVTVNHPKVIPLPIGIENKHFYVCGITSIFDKVIAKKYRKISRIFYGFTVSTNTFEREPALKALTKHNLAVTSKTWLNFKKYLNHSATYQFVASPPGSSIEGHRTWETLYIGSIPIVKESITIDYFQKLGVPLLSIKSWDEIKDITEKQLGNRFIAITEEFDRSTIFMDYWINKIKNLEK